MTVIEIIAAVLLILACIFVVAVVLMQESKQGMSNVITGGSTDNYYQKNSGRTREAQLARATKFAAIAIFVVALIVNVVTVYFGGNTKADSVDTSIVEEVDVTDAEETTAAETTPAETTAAETTVAE